MEDLAMKVWSMPADEFLQYCGIGLLFLFAIRETMLEINTNRIKRFNKR